MLSVMSQSSSKWRSFLKNKKSFRDFSGSLVVKNPEDAGSLPSQGTEISHAAGQLSLRAAIRENLCTATKTSAAKDKINKCKTIKIMQQ